MIARPAQAQTNVMWPAPQKLGAPQTLINNKSTGAVFILILRYAAIRFQKYVRYGNGSRVSGFCTELLGAV